MLYWYVGLFRSKWYRGVKWEIIIVGKAKIDIMIYAQCAGQQLPQRHMVLLKKADIYTNKKLTRLCKDCYLKVLDFIGISDIELY